MRKIPGASKAAMAGFTAILGDRLAQFRPTYAADNLITDHWLTTNREFEAAYANGMAQGLALGDDTRWRVRVACWAAEVGQKLGGAFVECGVARGFMSRVILDYLHIKEPFYLLDTYEGLDLRYVTKEHAERLLKARASGIKDRYAGTYDGVVKTFADAPNVRIIRGAVPDTLPQVDADRIAYLSLDMNAAIPEIAAIEYFWPKLVRGAFVVLDDYGWQGHEEQRHDFDDWAMRAGASLLSLPTGQGLIVKA